MSKKEVAKGKSGNGSGSIIQRGDVFQVRVTVPDVHGIPRRIHATLKTEPEAKKKLRQLLADRDRGILAAPTGTTFAEAAKDWLEMPSRRAKRTKKMYADELGYASLYIGKLRLTEIKPTHIKGLVKNLSIHVMKNGAAMSSRTQAKVLQQVRTILEDAVGSEVLFRNPAQAVKPIKGEAKPERGRPLDFEESARFLEVGALLYKLGMNSMWPALFLAISIGLRRGEVMGLRWADVDLERGTVKIENVQSMDDKNVMFTQTKGREAQVIRMPASLKAMLTAHKAVQDAQRLEATDQKTGRTLWTETGAVFTTETGAWSKPLRLAQGLGLVLKWSEPTHLFDAEADTDQAAKLAARRMVVTKRLGSVAFAELEAVILSGKVLPKISPHDLRHTFATQALASGVRLEKVSQILGHKDSVVTLAFYSHYLPSEDKEDAIDLFGATAPKREARMVAMA